MEENRAREGEKAKEKRKIYEHTQKEIEGEGERFL